MVKRILHLDDSRMALRMMERILKDSAEVLSAATVHDAETILSNDVVDMVITDYMLDDGNGIDFTRKLRDDERFRDIPILLVSAGLTDEIAFQAMRTGVNQSFRKPLRPAEIRQAVMKQLESAWIEDVQRSKLHLHGVSWKSNGIYYEYSPDLDHRVSAASKDEAHQEMIRQLQTLVGGRMNFEEVPELHIVEYDLDVE
jgi:two-component system chemotaxis response regulator CheY